MTIHKRTFVLSAAVVLAGLAVDAEPANAAGHSITLTLRPGSFITPSDRQAPQPYTASKNGLVDALCAMARRSSAWNCVPDLGPSSSSNTVAAGLPHLHLDIILRHVRNVAVSGTGVADLSEFEFLYTVTKITSTLADVSTPVVADPGDMVLVPPPGQTGSDYAPHDRLFRGVILNGCMGGAATFDLTLDSTAYRYSHAESLGKTHLTDAVNGHGYYNFEYTVRATDSDGNQSDFIVSGDADSVCTAKADLS